MTKRLALLQKLAQRSIARIPQSTRYGNLRFIKNLGGLPTVENGLTWLSPKTQYFTNLTTDVPFRLHHSYHHIPGGEYMVINPDAFKGVKPFTINPMDTILKNSEALVDPKYITIVSGNPGLLRQAKQQGFNIAITPELHTGYQRILGEINAPTNPFNRKLHKPLSFGQSGYAKQYRQAADDFFTRLGRPTHQDYLRLEQATGLPSYTIPFSQMQHNFNAGKAGVTWGNMSQPAFVYPDGREIIGTKILTKELDDFYKHVGYNPTPTTEINLLNQMGGFSKPHPTIFDVSPETGKIFEQWRMLNVPGSLKNGGKIAKYQSAGWIGKGIKWLSTKGDELLKFTKHAKINYSINKGSTRRFINRALKYSIPTSSDGFRLMARPKMLTIQPVNPSKDFGDFYKALEDLSWVNPKFRQFTGYGARPITISEFDDVMSGVQSGIQQNTKFVDDVDQIIRLKTSSPQHSSVENLIKFKKIPSYLGHGAESAVFQGSDLLHVYKTPHGPHLISGVDDSSFIWTDVSGVDIDDMYQKAINFANDFNSKYIYQEPISLIGYRKFTPLSITGDKIGRTSYIPVFKQLRGQVLNEATSIPSTASRYVKMLTNTSAAKKLRPYVLSQKWTGIDPNLGSQMHEMLIDFPKNNLFLENPNLNIMPIDAHFGNWGIFDGKLRGIDLHKNGGKIK